MEWSYDKNTDYTKLLNEAVAAGDYRRAAILEAQRNAKVRGENLGDKYQITSNYASYLPHQEQINSGMDQLAQPKEWSYDPARDQAWQAARKQYLREADRGTRDTMAARAGMTGGVPSTAAVAAGQQAGNYYRAQLMDRLPEFMQQDYSRWANNREMDRQDLQTLAGLDQQAADFSLGLQGQQWQQNFQQEQFNWQRQYTEQQAAYSAAMQRWETLGYADQAVADALGVPVGTSTQSAAYQQWQQKQNEQNTAYNRVMTWLQMGLMPSEADLAAAGITAEQAQQYINQVQQSYVGHYGSSGGSGSGGGGGYGSGEYSDGHKGTEYSADEILNAYRQVKNAIGVALNSHNINYAIEALDKYSDYLTEDMAAEIQGLLDKYFPGQSQGGSWARARRGGMDVIN